MKFRCAGIVNDSIVDGPGIRLAVFCQGCNWHCEECHNKHTWDYEQGYEEDTDNIIEIYKKNPLLSGITITGGEPFLTTRSVLAMTEIACAVHKFGGNVWTYTGYTLGMLIWTMLELYWPEPLLLLNQTDMLVDGPFMIDKRDLSLDWRGSSNQRLIDMRKLSKDEKFFDEFCKKENLYGNERKLLKICLNIPRS